MIKLLPNGNDINGILHQFPNLNATCESSSYQENISTCINAINVSHDHHFCSDRNINEWFSFHIPNIKMFVTHYSLQMPDKSISAGWAYPINWSFYGIYESGKEKLIHEVTNAGFTNTSRIKTFEIDHKDYFSKFKLVMEGANDDGYYDLRIYKIDLFGTIYSFFPFNIQTCKITPISLPFYMFAIFLS